MNNQDDVLEQEFAERLADAILLNRSKRANVLTPSLCGDDFRERLDAVAGQVRTELGDDFALVSQGPGRAALYGNSTYGLLYHRGSEGLVESVQLVPLSRRRPPSWPRSWWCVGFFLLVPLMLAVDELTTADLTNRMALSLAAVLLVGALWTNSRWDVVGVRWRPWWAAASVLAATCGWARGGHFEVVHPISSGVIDLVGMMVVSLPIILGRRRAGIPTLAIRSPFESDFRAYVLQGGASRRLNHHARHPEQRWALDVVPVDRTTRRSRPDKPVHVIAPIGGRVLFAVDEFPDASPPGEVVLPEGNHVIIEHVDDRGPVLLYLCHLAQGTVRVRTGDQIVAGEPVGVVGDSGRSTEPHLHLHLHLHAVRPGATTEPVPTAINGSQVWRGRTSSPASDGTGPSSTVRSMSRKRRPRRR